MTPEDLTQKRCCLALCTCEIEEIIFLPCLPSAVSEDFSQDTGKSRYLPQWRPLHSTHSYKYLLDSWQGQIKRQIHQRWLLLPCETPILSFLGINSAMYFLLCAVWWLKLQLPHRKCSLYDVRPYLTTGEEASRLASASPTWHHFMLQHVACWDFMGTNIQPPGLRNERGPAERLSQRGKIKRMGESEPAFEAGA